MPEIKLGREDSNADTMTWIGFADATEHLAKQSTVDQAALTRHAQGDALEDTPASSPTVMVEPQEDLAKETQTADSEHVVPPLDPESHPSESPVPPASATQPPPALAPANDADSAKASKAPESPHAEVPATKSESIDKADAPRLASHDVPPLPPPDKKADSQAEKKPLAPAQPPTAQPPPASKPQNIARGASANRPARRATHAGGNAIPGLPSDKESIAAAIRGADVVRPGKVLAAHGLDVKTVAPQWSITTQHTQRPRNPVVYIVFGRDGKVKEADFVRESGFAYDAGSAEVNEPLMTAIYSWRAAGKQLEALPPDDPDAGLTLVFTILLGP